MRRNVRFAVLSAMVLLLRAGSPAAADDSPEDVAERINKALDNQDATALVAEIAPSQRGEMLLEFADMVSMFAADPEKGAEINEEWESLVAEHGFTEDVKRWQEG